MANCETLYCLSGCTAVGKSDLALAWAERYGAEIVNCDSLLFYRGMDVGTAKPNADERARVRHHLVDLVEPSERMDVGRYLGLAVEAIRDIQGRGKRVLVTGGSGFYLKAFFEPVVDSVVVSESARAEAAGRLDQGLDVAVAELRDRNPDGLQGLDCRNPRRVMRALERCIETGKTLAQLRDEFARLDNPLVRASKRLTILERDREELARRIELRVERMLEDGLVEEVRGLIARGIETNPSAARAIGYREVIAYLAGEYDWDSMKEAICVNTRRLAKKQRTWFRGQLPSDARFLDLSGERVIQVEDLFA